MTRREIFSSLAAFTVIGTAVVVACIFSLAGRDLGGMAVLPVLGISFVVVAVCVSYIRAIRELRRRERV